VSSPTTPIEINDPEHWELLDLTQEMGRATVMRFRRVAGSGHTALGDDPVLPDRTKVVYTVRGRRWFAGTVLPLESTVAPSDEADRVVYTAADILEYLGNNPANVVSEWYNMPLTDTSIIDYPVDRTVRQIIEAEFAPIVGPGQPIGALDWSGVPTEVQDLIPRRVQIKDRTWIGVLDAITVEVPTLTYWLDPDTIPDGDIIGGTLRFFDVGGVPATATRAFATLPARGAAVSVREPNVIGATLTRDLSRSIDRLELHGWGTMKERREKAVRAWSLDPNISGYFSTPLPGGQVRPLRIDPSGGGSTGRIQKFAPDSGGGTWTNTTGLEPFAPWFPESRDRDARWVGLRYRVNYPIVDLKLVRSGAGTTSDPYVYSRAPVSMTVEVPAYRWYAGPVTFITPSGGVVSGRLAQGLKVVPYSEGLVDDWGAVRLITELYPGWATNDPTGGPLFSIGTPAAFDNAPVSGIPRGFFVLHTPRVSRTNYIFVDYINNPEIYPNNGHWLNLTQALSAPNPNDLPVFVYWDISEHVWLTYTGKEPLVAVVENPALNYQRTLRLLDPRFIKYTDIDNVVLRDDTAVLNAYAEMLFSLLSRERVSGTITVTVHPDDVDVEWPMGAGVTMVNWERGPDTYSLADVMSPAPPDTPTYPAWRIPSRVQQRILTRTATEHVLTVGFDREMTFAPLEMLTQFRAFFAGAEINGETASLGNSGITPGGGMISFGNMSGASPIGGGGGSGGASPYQVLANELGGILAVGTDCCSIDSTMPDPNASGSS
jgi:hypothetical protein